MECPRPAQIKSIFGAAEKLAVESVKTTLRYPTIAVSSFFLGEVIMTATSCRRTHATLVAMPLLLLGAAVEFRDARADVTVQEQTSMNMAGINMDITTVERITSDKQRRDTDTQCHGLLALACRDAQGGDIVRLDKQLQWQLQPKNKMYTEKLFPTEEERALAQQKLQAMMDQMKNCPMPRSGTPAQSGPDTSHCQLTAPTVDVKQTQEHATLAGHDTHKTSVVLSQTCADAQTGDVCEIDYGFDVWLTEDDLPGAAERRSFTQKYLAAQGLDRNNPQLRGMAQQFMAPYADTLKQLQAKGSDFKGYPLRTTFYMAFGGAHCGKAQQAQQAQQQNNNSGHGGGFLHGIAANAVSGGIGGLFHRNVDINTSSVGGSVAANAANQTADATASAAGNAINSAGSQPQAAGQPAASQTVRIVSFTTETKSIDTTAIAPDVFDIPGGWKLQPQKVDKSKEEFVCPTTGH
jgi:hypothetical protein